MTVNVRSAIQSIVKIHWLTVLVVWTHLSTHAGLLANIVHFLLYIIYQGAILMVLRYSEYPRFCHGLPQPDYCIF